MERFISKRLAGMDAYIPGEQPQDKRYIKLNTNEFPYPPSPKAQQVIACHDAGRLRLYPDPTARDLKQAIAAFHGLSPAQVFVGNGSDEVLAMAFLSFFDVGDPVFYPDITYDFYSVFANLFGLVSTPIALREDFTVSPEDYTALAGNVFLANPNAPTGLALKKEQIAAILQANPDRLVAIDEAYADFARENCVSLLAAHDNLLIIRTFSKSRALAGMRIGYALGNEALISAMEKAKYSFNPYNLNRLSLAAGCAAMADRAYFEATVESVVTTREWTKRELQALGFTVLDSETNFVFAKHPDLPGAALYAALKENGILVRHFQKPRIRDFVRITVGAPEEMKILFETLQKIL